MVSADLRIRRVAYRSCNDYAHHRRRRRHFGSFISEINRNLKVVGSAGRYEEAAMRVTLDHSASATFTQTSAVASAGRAGS